MRDPQARFSPSARRTAEALARATIPGGARVEEGNAQTIDRLEHLLGGWSRETVDGVGRMLSVLEQATRLTHRGRGFSSLHRGEAERFLVSWVMGDVGRRTLIQLLTAPLKVAHFDEPAAYEKLQGRFKFEVAPEVPRFMQQVSRGAELHEDAELECDVVVVGTGAGGAVVAKELADKGLAVLMLEEGEYHLRHEFDGRGVDNLRKLYRGRGTIGSIGNTFIPIPMGRLVGGSTAINTGTCWRTPEWVLEKWVEKDGLSDLTPERMSPYFDRVERELQVEAADAKYLGGAARVIARGCDVLGYSHRPLRRNAPGCDGSGVCDMGCPTDARRSTNVSYVPSALRRGASLYTGMRAEKVIREGARAVGIVARSVATGRLLTVRARATVLSGGTAMTPVLMMKQGLDRGLPHVGKNLSIHPATMVSALFDEEIKGYNAIPQGYCIDEFRREGILLMGASAPIDLGAGQFAFVGKKFTEIMDAYDRIASFGVMVDDESRGRVAPGPRGRPLMLYRLGRKERERLRRGTEIVSRVFLAAGAREVYPGVHGHRIVRSPDDLAKLAASLPAAADWLLTAFHPLGTCRMATSARDGVVSPENEVFGVPGLYIADGSVVPSSVGVNPQVTIMAFATRAADILGARLA